MGNLWIYQGDLFQQENFAAPEETEYGVALVKLKGLDWLPQSECRLVTFEEVRSWFLSEAC